MVSFQFNLRAVFYNYFFNFNCRKLLFHCLVRVVNKYSYAMIFTYQGLIYTVVLNVLTISWWWFYMIIKQNKNKNKIIRVAVVSVFLVPRHCARKSGQNTFHQAKKILMKFSIKDKNQSVYWNRSIEREMAFKTK